MIVVSKHFVQIPTFGHVDAVVLFIVRSNKSELEGLAQRVIAPLVYFLTNTSASQDNHEYLRSNFKNVYCIYLKYIFEVLREKNSHLLSVKVWRCPL